MNGVSRATEVRWPDVKTNQTEFSRGAYTSVKPPPVGDDSNMWKLAVAIQLLVRALTAVPGSAPVSAEYVIDPVLSPAPAYSL